MLLVTPVKHIRGVDAPEMATQTTPDRTRADPTPSESPSPALTTQTTPDRTRADPAPSESHLYSTDMLYSRDKQHGHDSSSVGLFASFFTKPK